jgi:hypothetical protein
MMDWPDELVLKTLRELDQEAVERLFGIGDMPESELAMTDEPSLTARRNDLLLASESLLRKLGPRGTIRIERVGFASKVGARTTPVRFGATGRFQISGSDQWYTLDARSGSCKLEVYERKGLQFEHVATEEPTPGTVIQPVSYETSYIIGRGRRNVRVAAELRRLRDFLLGVQDPEILVVFVV